MSSKIKLITQKDIEEFRDKGFIIKKNFFSKKDIKRIKPHIRQVLKGKYTTGINPDKIKKDYKNNQIIQISNFWKSNNYLKKKISLNKKIGKIAKQLMNWGGTKLCEDGLFRIKPRSGGVTMHQDNPYQDWHVPGKIITAWIPLTKININSSGIEYVLGSHKTKTLKPVKKFFSGKNYSQKIKKKKLFKVVCSEGTLILHHGNLIHGSNVNMSNQDRISISLHLISSNSKFNLKINHKDWSKYKLNNSSEMMNDFFPNII